MPARLLIVLLLGLAMGGCARQGGITPQAGYAVDTRHVASSHSSRVHHLVLHYTDADEVESLAILTGPRVSAHYLLPRPARHHRGKPLVYRLVAESRRAWHAGASAWAGHHHLNDTSIGIEIVNPGPSRSFTALEAGEPVRWAPFPDAQIAALIPLLRDLIARHDIAATDILSHAEIAPTRKIDPGPAFPWRRLFAAGIGTWPDAVRVARHRRALADRPPALATLQRALAAWGYAVTPDGSLDAETRGALRAFQMRYRPTDYRGEPDLDTAARLWALLEQYRPEALEQLDKTSADLEG
ncbi:N-acetylmuramoyl-L-alanine amidase [Halomonas stenophila]|uniref:N-acetylmuramoyl-L-alanine amidase n=1 Tax=Halomonas stenophila TaxID=795312 RepID=A0A7W5EWG9_9GAMM|nr:N-acetylmuramoyl-L-alanine amidase [Halomonas stenophila]MBB3232713.1 N-acetylmuramoyl-L-alanine amidase [Halomonas stenophila]